MTFAFILFAFLGSWFGNSAAATDIVFANSHQELRLGADAIVKSLTLKATGEELLATRDPIPFFSVTQERPYNNEIKLAYPNARTVYPANRLRREGDKLIVGFAIAPYEAVVAVKVSEDYIAFTLEKFLITEKSYPLCPTSSRPLDMDAPPVAEFRIAQLPVANRQNFGEWLNVMWDDAAAVAVVATSPRALIGSEPRNGSRILKADAERTIGLKGTGAAIVAAAGREPFLDRLDALERDFELPRGVANRRNPLVNASVYWSSGVCATNIDEHIALAKQGGFRLMLIYTDSIFTNLGDYEFNRNYWPNGLQDLAAALAKVRAAGIIPGIHVLHTYASLGRSRLTAPAADPRLGLKDRFTLAQPLSPSDTLIEVQEHPLVAPRHPTCRVLKFGSELITYAAVTTEPPYRFLGCQRGAWKTTPTAHPAAEIGGVLDVSEFGGNCAYIAQNSNLQDEIAAKIAAVWSAGFGFIYFDGSEGVQAPFGYNVPNAQYRVWRRLQPQPFLGEGAAKAHFGWHMLSGANAFDIFSPEEFKAAIVRYPLAEAPLMRQDMSRCNFGWWGFWYPGETVQGHTTIGTQPDMIEYGTSKAAAWDCPATVQIRLASAKKHPRLKDCMEVFRRWERVRAEKSLTDAQREAVRDPQREFHLYPHSDGRLELVEIEMLKVPAAAKNLRAFVFKLDGVETIAYWDVRDRGEYAVALGAVATLKAADLQYLPTELSRDEIRAAFEKVKVKK